VLSSVVVSSLSRVLRAARVYTRRRSPWSRAVALALLAPALLVVPVVRAQTRLSFTPAMTRGSTAAPVVIVEFSDYQ
jgi:protein-disulfide isomerase